MAFVNDPQAFVCTPSSMLASSPCLACLSPKELLAVLVAIVGYASGKTVAEVMTDSACFNCLNEKQKLQALVTKLGNDLLGERYTAAEMVEAMHCLVCVSEAQLTAALIQLLCANITISVNAEQ